MKTLTLEDFKANTKEWFLEQLGNMSAPQALRTISDLYDELHKPTYPKTYEECCEMLNTINSGNPCIVLSYLGRPISSLAKLIIIRDAYWKIAGDWKPNWINPDNTYYTITIKCNEICKSQGHRHNTILAFPTEEMRNAFHENFKDLIENCKELL
jgi:hypothetical protein